MQVTLEEKLAGRGRSLLRGYCNHFAGSNLITIISIQER
jgi:hypothetical protein